MKHSKMFGVLLLASLSWLQQASGQAPAGNQSHPFGVSDDIAIAQFGDVHAAPREDVLVSPDERWVMVHIVRPQLQANRLTDQLLFYRLRDLKNSLENPTVTPAPAWKIDYSSGQAFAGGPLLSQFRWLDDSSGVGFLKRSDGFHKSLYLADLRSFKSIPLGHGHNHLLGYAIKDANRYVLVEPDSAQEQEVRNEADAAAMVGTGKSYLSLMAPLQAMERSGRGVLVSISSGIAKRLNYADGSPIVVYDEGIQTISISPDARYLVSAVAVRNIPAEWPTKYLPSYPSEWTAIAAGPQDLNQLWGAQYLSQYAMVDLTTGSVDPLLSAPTASRAGWLEASARPAWSFDGSHLLLPSTFDSSAAVGARPCAYVFDVATGARQCLRELKRDLPHGFEEGWARISTMSFQSHRNDAAVLSMIERDKLTAKKVTYRKLAGGNWSLTSEDAPDGIRVFVRADFAHSPVLEIEDSRRHLSRTILDPNPQLKTVNLGSPELFRWIDAKSRTQTAILYKPLGYRQGTRYPLVIQNHGYSLDRFEPNGGFASANAAQELASAGIAVLQMRDCDGRVSGDEGQCNVDLYASVIDALERAGIVDRHYVGLIGFSRTVYYVLSALTANAFPIKAASITDGISLGYINFMLNFQPDRVSETEAEKMIGSFPARGGLDLWQKHSPVFNLDRVSAPLRIVSTKNVAELWETYALLSHYKKPVDLIVLNTREHVITEPRIRLETQGGNVDWFRFWLQGWEDPDPLKRPQYVRWEKLRADTETK